MPQNAIGIAWYHRHQWERMREVSENREKMAVLYDDWLKNAESQVKKFESSGTAVHKVYMDVDLLIAWAARHNVKINMHGRTLYTNYLLAHHMGMNKKDI